jgi:hypothetical protein
LRELRLWGDASTCIFVAYLAVTKKLSRKEAKAFRGFFNPD